MTFSASLVLLCLAYVCGLIWLDRGLAGARRAGFSGHANRHTGDFPTLTIVVCARNEERNLVNLLPALARQNYPAGRLEIVLVNDRSRDRTEELLQAFASQHAQALYFRIDDEAPGLAPKKRAINLALHHTGSEIILLTDADGIPGENWAAEMAAQFQPGVVMVCGYSPYYPRNTLAQKILALEYFSHAAVAAGSIGAGRPLTCTGSNLAYRRDAFFSVGGFEGVGHWISGDDDLLLHKMHAQHAGKIAYVAHPATHVPVKPPASWQELQSQRTRYASKGRFYHWKVTLALIAVYVLNLLLCLGVAALLFGQTRLFVSTLLCGAGKAVVEFAYLRRASAWFQEQDLLRYFPLAAVLHPFYIVYFSTRAQFATFAWRGEQFAARAEQNYSSAD
jgi:cellulose synthase/poly-beta-1,6-N-acetylglucosamine synthase-like glycosyltransferase